MRAFVGTFLSAAHQAYYARLAGDLCARFPRLLHAVPAESVHVTCAFMRLIPSEQVAEVQAALSRVAGTESPIAIALEAPGVLWAGRSPRLVEVRVGEGGSNVMRLVGAVAAELRAALPALDIQPARSAHATLLRFRRSATRQDARRVEGSLAGGVRRETLDRLALVSSELTPAGAVYTVISEHELGQR